MEELKFTKPSNYKNINNNTIKSSLHGGNSTTGHPGASASGATAAN